MVTKRERFIEEQQEAQLEGLAIGLEQIGEKSAAHLIRAALRDLKALREDRDNGN